jgi:DNA-binding CsgD family transcriptional regulator
MTLTDREHQVLALLADGHTKAAIARRLGLTEDGVKDACQRIYRKLDARNAVHAVAIAHQRGLLAADADTDVELAVVRCLRMPGYRLALARTETPA